MQYPALRNRLARWRGTPLHPQWHILRNEVEFLAQIGRNLHGIVLDIGCADKNPARFIPAGTRYIGLDYYETATRWYGTQPHVYGDAQALPFPSQSVDCVLLLDVLEHLPRPTVCLSEAHRVLKPHGTLVVQVPFLYPIHDAPLDFTRWTAHGLERLATHHGFQVAEQVVLGHPLETAALLSNIALSKTVLNWVERRNPAAIAILILPIFVLLSNVFSWAIGRIAAREDMMPIMYRLVLVKE
jgi:SAM-dependent methyltransferase